MKVIGTHDGRFHADEVLAISILKRVFPDVKVIRSRDPKKWEEVDILVDVGNKYDPKKNFFDHHQESFKDKRENGVPYASAGLVWKHFGAKILKNKKAWNYVDKSLIQAVDKVDADSSLTQDALFLYTIDKAVGSFRPLWNSKEQDWDRGFNEALSIVGKILDNEIAIAKSISEADLIVEKAIKEAEKEKRAYIFVSNPNMPFMDKCLESENIKYVLYPYFDGNWHAKGVGKNSFTYETRKPYPSSWRGLHGELLEIASGVKGAIFCHKAGFLAGAETKETMIKMVEESLNS